MKKLLAILGLVTMVGSSSAILVSCGPGGGAVNNEIYLITDAGKVDDKSFNQSGFQGGNIFNKEILGNEGEIGKIEPVDLESLDQVYENAKADGAKTLILPGFHHAVEGANKAADIMNGTGSTIILDSDNGNKDNQVGILYRGDISGFLAGFASLVKASNDETIGLSGEVKMATFGGAHNAKAVDSFMAGYLASIELFNKIINEASGPEGEVQQKASDLKDKLGIGSLVTKASRVDTQKEAPTSDGDTKWFTNSFNMGDGKTISDDLVKQNANIIMPVAGPQTADALTAAKGKDKTFLIGVDTDQTTQYTANDGNTNKFFTSAEKALVEATVMSLGHVDEFREDTEVQDLILNYAADKNLTNSFTVEDKNGKFTEYDLAKNKKESWEGQTLWMGGKISTSEGNRISEAEYNDLSEVLSPDILQIASINWFATVDKDGSAKNVLSNDVIKQYSEDIYAELINK